MIICYIVFESGEVKEFFFEKYLAMYPFFDTRVLHCRTEGPNYILGLGQERGVIRGRINGSESVKFRVP